MYRVLLACLVMASSFAALAAADSSRPLSARALEIEKMKSKDRDALDARCRITANWKTPDCLARIEVEEARAAENRRSAEYDREFLRDECAAGDKAQCIKLACPGDGALYRRTDAEVRACSRARGLPTTAKWAQVSESRDDYQHRFGYVCLQPMHFLDPYGVKISMFAGANVTWRVTDEAGPKSFEEEVIKDRTFTTKDAAATAGCVAEVPRTKEFLKAGGLTPLD
jgi:hypothetical protein